jgi:HipA-like C-terminal domain.
MKMLFMNQEIPVAELEINETFGRIQELTKSINPEYLPLLVTYQKDKEGALQKWLQSRSIPKTRKNFSALLEGAGVATADALSIKSLGLNLSDQYWFKPVDSNLQWKDVNLFQNDFLPQRFSVQKNIQGSSYSPDVSSNGELPKFWTIKNDKRYLYKESTAPYYQQGYNEVYASKLLDIMEVPHVKYSLDTIKDVTYSVCETFITPETEYVPALYIKDVCPKLNHENDYQHFVRCMEKLEIPCTKAQLETMLGFDYLIHNNDRHYGNFGFIREVKSQKILGMAPLFDHGNSLWYREINQNMKFKNQEAKPFKEDHEKQFQLIKNSMLPLEKLTNEKIHQLTQEVFSKNNLIDKDRIERLQYNVVQCAKRLLERQQSYTIGL